MALEADRANLRTLGSLGHCCRNVQAYIAFNRELVRESNGLHPDFQLPLRRPDGRPLRRDPQATVRARQSPFGLYTWASNAKSDTMALPRRNLTS